MTEQNEQSMAAIFATLRSVLADDDDDVSDSAEEEKESAVSPASVANEEKEPEPVKVSVPAPDPEPVSESVAEKEEENDSKTQLFSALENESDVEEEEDAPADSADATSSDDDVLDLTAEMIVGAPSDKKDEPKRTPIAFPSVEDDKDDDFTPEPVIPREPMKEETLTDLIKENAVKNFGNDMLLAEPTVVAATESLSHLRDIASERQLDLGNGNLTIEAIVRETMKPYLKEWLDLHLPEIVERVVRKEVAHIMDRLDLK